MSNVNKFSVWTIILGVGVILGILGSAFLVEDRIEKRIDEKLKDPETMQKIASLVRPYQLLLTITGQFQQIVEPNNS